MTCQSEVLERKRLLSSRGNELNHFIADLSFEEKVKKSCQTIKKALKDHGKKPVISSSFGKDSMVLTHLIHSVRPEIPIVFVKTGQQFPETIQYMRDMKEQYGYDIIELTPKQSFWDIVKQHGYPKQSRNSKTGDKREPACCKILKFKPMENFIKEWKPSLNFTGLIGDEGRQRRMCYVMHGSPTYYIKTLNLWRCMPLIWWIMKDVWQYHNEYNIHRNPVYEKYGIDRTGCMACTGHINWQEKMQKVSFPLYHKVSNEMGQPLIEDFMKPINRGVERD